MRKMWFNAMLALILLAAFFVRVYPATQTGLPMRFDSYYHVRVAELIKSEGEIPSWEPWPHGGRPHSYPPGYHLLLVASDLAFQSGIIDASRFVLPFASSMLVVAGYWITRKLRGAKTALMAAFFLAINPYLVSASYDSPQIIGMLLSFFAVYFLIKKMDIRASLLLAAAFFFNPFSLAIVSLPIALYLLLSRGFRRIAKAFSFPVLAAISWFLRNAEASACYNNWIGPSFIYLKVGNWINFVTPIFVFLPLLALGLIDRIGSEFRKFWAIWVFSISALFLTHFISPFAHPWRTDFYIMVGVCFLMADLLANLDWRKLFLFAAFSAASIFSLYVIFHASSLMLPPLMPNEYALVSHLDSSSYPDFLPLANHDICSNILTLSDKTCLLDINFECIPEPQKWHDYEQFFWAGTRQEMKGILNRNQEISYVVYSSGDWGRSYLETMDVDKTYASWFGSSPDAAVYRINRDGGNASYFGG